MNKSKKFRILTLSTTCLIIIYVCFSILSKAGPNKTDPLLSWNDGSAKQKIVAFVKNATDKNNPGFIPEDDRIATFDQDGTIWVEKPVYTQLIFALDRIKALAQYHPEWKKTEPFKSVLNNDKDFIKNISYPDLIKLVAISHAGMTTDEYEASVIAWLSTVRDERWHRPYTELVYQPMIELMNYLKKNGFKIYIVSGASQDFIRAYAKKVYGLSQTEIIGSAFATKYTYDNNQKPVLIRTTKILLNGNNAGKAENLYLFLGTNKPKAAFGNSTGDREMLEYTQSNSGPTLQLLVHHDDSVREYAYDAESRVGTFTKALEDEAIKKNWIIVSMKNDWKRIFAFDK